MLFALIQPNDLEAFSHTVNKRSFDEQECKHLFIPLQMADWLFDMQSSLALHSGWHVAAEMLKYTNKFKLNSQGLVS